MTIIYFSRSGERFALGGKISRYPKKVSRFDQDLIEATWAESSAENET